MVVVPAGDEGAFEASVTVAVVSESPFPQPARMASAETPQTMIASLSTS